MKSKSSREKYLELKVGGGGGGGGGGGADCVDIEGTRLSPEISHAVT